MTNESATAISPGPAAPPTTSPAATAATGRNIFRYHDGQRDRYGDPWLIFRRLKYNGTVDVDAIAAPCDDFQEPERSQYLNVVRDAFEVKAWDDSTGEGLTEDETIALVGQLAEYLELQKKSTSRGRTSLPPTDSESSTSPEPPNQPTSEPSDSGETRSELKSGGGGT